MAEYACCSMSSLLGKRTCMEMDTKARPPLRIRLSLPCATSGSAAAKDEPLDERAAIIGPLVLGSSELVVLIARLLDPFSARSLYRTSKNTARSIDFLGLAWCFRSHQRTLNNALGSYAPVSVSTSRIKSMIAGQYTELWKSLPLLKWVVKQAASQGDIELLTEVLAKTEQHKREAEAQRARAMQSEITRRSQ